MDVKAVTFVNFTDREFVGKWDGEEYPFAAGQTGLYKSGQARTFARQLGIAECNRKNDDYLGKLNEYIAKALPSDIPAVEGKESKVESEIINYNPKAKKAELEEVAKQAGIDTTGKKKDEIVSDLAAFEGAEEVSE